MKEQDKKRKKKIRMESILGEKQRMTPSKCSGEIYNKINEINSVKNTWNYNESSEKRVSAKIRKQKQTNKKTRKKKRSLHFKER